LLLIASVMVLGLLVQRLALIQVQGVLRFIGNKGRQVIAEIHLSMTQAEVEQEKDQDISTMVASDLPVTQAVVYWGEPMAIAAYDVHKLVDLARKADGLIVMPFAVGDTVIDGGCFLTLRGGRVALSETEFLSAVRLELERTFEQDPSTLFVCLWISPYERCRRRSMIRQPRFKRSTRSRTCCVGWDRASFG
jgi:uncharacterized membrane protein